MEGPMLGAGPALAMSLPSPGPPCAPEMLSCFLRCSPRNKRTQKLPTICSPTSRYYLNIPPPQNGHLTYFRSHPTASHCMLSLGLVCPLIYTDNCTRGYIQETYTHMCADTATHIDRPAHQTQTHRHINAVYTHVYL